MNFTTLYKHYQAISLISLIIFFALFFIQPEGSSFFAIALILLCLGMSFALIIHRNRKLYLQNKVTRQTMIRNNIIQLLGLSFILLAATFTGQIVGTWTGYSVKQSHPGFGMYASLIAGMACAFAVAWAMRIGWAKAVRMITRG